MQHLTGLFEKIPKTSDPKEIEAWRAERRKRYPTKKKAEEKEAEKLEKISRGEVLDDPSSQPKLSSKPRDIRARKTFPNDRFLHRRPKKDVQKRRGPPRFFMGNMRIEIVDGLPPDYESNKKAALELLAPAAEEPAAEELLISDDEFEAEVPPTDSSKNLCSVLSALCAAYNSSTSDEDAPPIETKAIVSKASEEAAADTVSKEEESADVSLKKSEPPLDTQSRKRTRKRPVKQQQIAKIRPPLPAPSSLLQKLLAKEIRKERNQILQCVRYIVANDYFEPRNSDAISRSGDEGETVVAF